MGHPVVEDSRYSRSTVTMCVSTFVSPNAEFLATQETVLVLSLGPMVRLVLEADTQPPAAAGLTEVLEEASRLLPPA